MAGPKTVKCEAPRASGARRASGSTPSVGPSLRADCNRLPTYTVVLARLSPPSALVAAPVLSRLGRLVPRLPVHVWP